MNLMPRILITLVLLLSGAASALAQENDWPRTVALDQGMVTIYAPQVEAMNGEVLYYRSALAYRPQADAEPIFGAGWFKSPVEIDEDQRIVHPARLELTQTRFPDGTADVQAELATALAQQSPAWNLDFSVDELEAALEQAEAESLAAQKLKTTPPKIIYRDHPALLVTIDGDPVLREIENSTYEAVINTPFPLISDGDDFYLNAAKGVWYRADKATGPYRFDASPPEDIVQMVEASKTESADETGPNDEAPKEPVTAANAPEIVVSTEPAELIVTDGPADFVPLVDDLLVLENSDDDVFMHVGEQKYYIVLAGRWYRADSLNGPWEYQAADALPADFAEIPDDSTQADSRVHVAGTPEAEEAVLNAQMPQTAKVERGEVDIDVEYDGDPDFEPVEGTEDLHYAKNTGATVLESDRVYYLLEDGVWYVSSSPHGPWVVSDHRPGELESVSPKSPMYNTKYVYVYDSTPDVVYVGYTPGYLGSYVYHNTIVYGTGWYYRPWVSPRYYYPRHRTWGFHVGYSDWGGWSFGLSWYWPYYSLNYYYGGYWHHGRPWYNRYWGYWGPRGYWYRPHYYGHHGYRHHAYRHHGKRHGHRGQHRWDNNYGRRHDQYARERHRNLYRDDRQRARIADTWDRSPNRPGPRSSTGSEMRYVDNRKVRQSSTGPVQPADLRMKARVREVNRAAAREPMVANSRGEVYRASFNNAGPRDATRERAASSRDQEIAARRDAQNLVSQRSARNSKIRQSRTEPVTRNELRARARAQTKRDESRTTPVSRNEIRTRTAAQTKRRESRTEPVTRNELRARAAAQTKRHENRTTPVTRNEIRTRTAAQTKRKESRVTPISRGDLGQRADFANHRGTRKKPSVTQPVPRPSRKADRAARQVTSPPRRVTSKTPRTRPSREIASPPREVQRREPRTRPSREIASPPRQVQQRAPRTRPNREVASPARQVKQRAPRTQPTRKISAPSRQAHRSAPASRAPARSAPTRSAPTRSAPTRSAPARSNPPRSAPARSAPKQKAQRSAPKRERGKARERRRK